MGNRKAPTPPPTNQIKPAPPPAPPPKRLVGRAGGGEVHPVNMKPPDPSSGQFKVIIAEDQPEYDPVPAIVDREAGMVITEWKLTPDEVTALSAGARIRMFTQTNGQPFQPVVLECIAPTDVLPLEPVS